MLSGDKKSSFIFSVKYSKLFFSLVFASVVNFRAYVGNSSHSLWILFHIKFIKAVHSSAGPPG
jgi:hypothetical protein